MALRLIYLILIRLLDALGLPPDISKDAEILVLRHQLAALRRPAMAVMGRPGVDAPVLRTIPTETEPSGV